MDSYEPCFHLWVLYSPSNLVLAHTFFFTCTESKYNARLKFEKKSNAKQVALDCTLVFSLMRNDIKSFDVINNWHLFSAVTVNFERLLAVESFDILTD